MASRQHLVDRPVRPLRDLPHGPEPHRLAHLQHPAARFPFLTLTGTPADARPGGDLKPRRLDVDADGDADLHAQREVERSILDSARGEDEVRWLLEDREGYLYVREDGIVGFAFVGKSGVGPIAALDRVDLPDILLHVEGRASELGIQRLELQVPAPNEIATRHLLGRGFLLDPWVNLLMSNRPFGRFDRVISFGPPVFLCSRLAAPVPHPALASIEPMSRPACRRWSCRAHL